LQSAASGSSIGIATAAASVITAVALTAGVAGSAGPDVSSASAASRQKPTGVQDARTAESAPQEVPTESPTPSIPSGERDHEESRGHGTTAPPDPVEARDGERGTEPQSRATPTTAAPAHAISRPQSPPTASAGAPATDLPQAPPTTSAGPPEVDPPAAPSPSSRSGCEAAVRSVPGEDTVFAYRLDEADDATTAVDFVHGAEARYEQSRSTPGWSLSDAVLRPATDVFTVQVWFRNHTGGGRLLGYSSDVSGASWAYDRHLFLADDGRVVFGVFPGAVHTVSSEASYADGRWHQATASLSGDGMALYVDGHRVAADSTVTSGHDFAGYWRIGADNLDNWGPDTPSTRAFAGTLAFAAVYRTALTAEQIRTQWELCG